MKIQIKVFLLQHLLLNSYVYLFSNLAAKRALELKMVLTLLIFWFLLKGDEFRLNKYRPNKTIVDMFYENIPQINFS